MAGSAIGAMVGEVVGSYRIVQQLDRGGMGVVYVADHVLLGRKAAVKVLQPQYSSEPQSVQRFFNEARAAATIRHPGIVDVFDFGYLPNGSAYLIMEFLDGESLAARLSREPWLPVDLLAAIGRQLANAMGAAHARGIYHRDLKPANIFLVPQTDMPFGLRVKVLDFGVAKLTGDLASALQTTTTALVGTPSYMSPEQCRGAGFVDHRGDIYAAGCILFRMACGRLPFPGQGAGEVIAAHIYETPARPSTVRPGLPSLLDEVIGKALAKRPEDRQQTMAELGLELDRISSLHPVPRSELPPLRRTTRPPDEGSPVTVVAPPRALSHPRELSVPRASYWYSGLDAAELIARIEQHKARPSRVISYRDHGRQSYAAALVTDEHPTQWWWYSGIDGDALSAKLVEHRARPIDLESYDSDDGDRRFGVVLAPQGNERSWWFHGLDKAQLEQKLIDLSAEIVDLDAFLDDANGRLKLTAVLAPATGADWSWHVDLDARGLVAKLEALHARPVCLKSYGEGAARKYAALMAHRADVGWRLQSGLDAAGVTRLLSDTNSYIADFDVHLDGGAPRFSVIAYQR